MAGAMAGVGGSNLRPSSTKKHSVMNQGQGHWSRAAALLPLNLNQTLLKQGTGTTDHLLPLGCY